MPQTQIFTMRIPVELAEKIRTHAHEAYITKTKFVLLSVEKYIEHLESKKVIDM